MKRYLYTLVIALLIIIGSSVRLNAQTTPSGTPNTAVNDEGNNRTNYNYLGFLGLLGLYGLHKKRTSGGTVVDRKS